MIDFKFLRSNDSVYIERATILISRVFGLPRAIDPFTFRDNLNKQNCSVVVAIDGDTNEVVATATINYIRIPWEYYNQGYISYVCCDEKYRRRGITTYLMNMLINDAKAHCCSCVFLDSNFKKRKAAHKMYKKLGFNDKESKFFIKYI